MGKILNDVLGVTYEDEDRLRNIINEMIEAGELKATRCFVAEPEKRKAKRRKAAEREAEVLFLSKFRRYFFKHLLWMCSNDQEVCYRPIFF